jgi:hypothetical protein
MNKFVSGAVIGIAVGVLGLVVAVGSGLVGWHQPVDAKAPADSTVTRVKVPTAKTPRKVAAQVRAAPRGVEPTTTDMNAVTDMGVPADSALPTVAFDPAAIVKELTPEEVTTLFECLSRRSSDREKRWGRHMTGYGREIEFFNDDAPPELKLNDAQKALLKTIHENMQPRMDTVLKDLWDREDEMQEVFSAFWKLSPEEQARRQDEFKALSKKHMDLNRQMQPLEDQFNAEFTEAAKAVLTPQQQQGIAEMNERHRRAGGFSTRSHFVE